MTLLLALACFSSTPTPKPAAPVSSTPEVASVVDLARACSTSGAASSGVVASETAGGQGFTLNAEGTIHCEAHPSHTLALDAWLPEAASDAELVLSTAEGVELARWKLTRRVKSVRSGLPDGPFSLTLEGAETALVADPVAYKPKADPRRVVLIYLDTTRADHLQTWGYERETSPALLQWSEGAAVFETARTVAPWTLPSIRAVLTGEQPELWASTPNLPERLGSHGFATRASFTNVYLTPNFDMNRGWRSWRYRLKKPAAQVVDEGIAWLQDHNDRDALLILQFMDTHLPYREPKEYQGRWTSTDWQGTELKLRSLRKIKPDAPEIVALQQHVTGRYDQALRYVDDQLARLLPLLDDDDIVVVFGDHGEELWDHGGFEHGHNFHDEVMRVPLMIRGGGLQAGRTDTAVSLLDLTPTVLDLLGLPPAEVAGRSLVPVAAGEDTSSPPLVFGRPLYGMDGWGVVTPTYKWWGRPGAERYFALASDPAEDSPVAVDKINHDQVSRDFRAGWSGELHRGWTLYLDTREAEQSFTLTASHPEGIARAWPAYSPSARAPIPAPEVTDGVMTFRWSKGQGHPSGIFLQPVGPAEQYAGLTLTLTSGEHEVQGTMEPLGPAAFHRRNTLFQAGEPGFTVRVRAAWMAEPRGRPVIAFSESSQEELRVLGYVH